MALQTSIATRITIRGDGISKEITLDLRTTMIQYVNGTYNLLPILPSSVISANIGGPNLSPESQLPEVIAKLDGPILKLMFSVTLQDNKDHYTVEIIFGYDSVSAPKPPEAIV